MTEALMDVPLDLLTDEPAPAPKLTKATAITKGYVGTDWRCTARTCTHPKELHTEDGKCWYGWSRGKPLVDACQCGRK